MNLKLQRKTNTQNALLMNFRDESPSSVEFRAIVLFLFFNRKKHSDTATQFANKKERNEYFISVNGSHFFLSRWFRFNSSFSLRFWFIYLLYLFFFISLFKSELVLLCISDEINQRVLIYKMAKKSEIFGIVSVFVLLWSTMRSYGKSFQQLLKVTKFHFNFGTFTSSRQIVKKIVISYAIRDAVSTLHAWFDLFHKCYINRRRFD